MTATMALPRLYSADLESRVKEKRKSMMASSVNQSAPSTGEGSGATLCRACPVSSHSPGIFSS